MASGDECLFQDGTWSGTAINRFTPRWNACDGPNGSPGAPTRYAAAPGASPVFESFGASGVGIDCGFIEIEGIHTTQSSMLWSLHDVRVTGGEMEGGGPDCDGNWAVFRVEGVQRVQIDHNNLHHMVGRDGCRIAALLQVWRADDSTIEFNTFDGTDTENGNLENGLTLKESPINVQVRYNHFIQTRLRGSNQQSRDPPRTGRNVENFGNVVEGRPIHSWVLIEDTNIHHNTLINGPLLADGTFSPRLKMRNNIVSGVSDFNIRMTHNYWPPVEFDLDHNVYDADASYQGNGFADAAERILLNDVGAWASALQTAGCVGCEANSQEADCAFEAGSDTDYHIAGGACLTAADDGGEVGAYALTDCVGHTCGSGSAPPLLDGGMPDGGMPREPDGGLTFDGGLTLDAGTEVDSGMDSRMDSGMDAAPEGDGGGCNAAPGQAHWWWAGLSLIGLRRRRRRCDGGTCG